MTEARFSSGHTVVVHAPGRTARHEAAFDWVLSAVLGLSWRWEDDAAGAFRSAVGVRMHYGLEAEWPGVDFRLTEFGSDRVWTPSPRRHAGAQADLFSAVFWMASRMEEFLEDAPRDEHGRFDPTGSLPELKGWLDSPICERWAWTIGERLLGRLAGAPRTVAR